MNATPVIVERTYHASVDRVWKALTSKAEMKEWYFDLAEFKAEVGFSFSFYAGDERKQFLHLCTITEVVEKKKLAYSWRYDGYPGESFVTFELFAEGDQTKVRVTHEGLETFPKTDGDHFAASNFAEGWKSILGDALRKHVEA